MKVPLQDCLMWPEILILVDLQDIYVYSWYILEWCHWSAGRACLVIVRVLRVLSVEKIVWNLKVKVSATNNTGTYVTRESLVSCTMFLKTVYLHRKCNSSHKKKPKNQKKKTTQKTKLFEGKTLSDLTKVYKSSHWNEAM